MYAIGVCERGHGHEIIVMSFVETLDNLALKKSELVNRFEHLIAPKSDREFEAMAQTSRALTLQNFGRTMRLFAPLYLSNECINNCRYCGFSRDNPILRVTLNVDEVVAEAQHLARQGFRQILLVAGEHPKFAGRDYLAECVRTLGPDFSSISIEVGPMKTEDYVPIVEAGAEGLVVYQETYNRGIYAEMRAGKVTPMGGVYIEMSHLGPDIVADMFPGMVKRCADCGFDLVRPDMVGVWRTQAISVWSLEPQSDELAPCIVRQSHGIWTRRKSELP